MSDDLVKRLRDLSYNQGHDLPDKAANRIEKLEAGEIEFDRIIGDYASENARFRDRIEKLERDVLKYSSAVADAQMRNEELDRALNRIIDRWEAQKARIEKLEAALDDALQYISRADWHYLKDETRKALDAE